MLFNYSLVCRERIVVNNLWRFASYGMFVCFSRFSIRFHDT